MSSLFSRFFQLLLCNSGSGSGSKPDTARGTTGLPGNAILKDAKDNLAVHPTAPRAAPDPKSTKRPSRSSIPWGSSRAHHADPSTLQTSIPDTSGVPPKDPDEDLQDTNQLLPDEISFELEILLDRKTVHKGERSQTKWRSSRSYEAIENQCLKILEPTTNFKSPSDNGQSSSSSKSICEGFYLKSGRCDLIDDLDSRVFASRTLEGAYQWKENITLLVTSFTSENLCGSFHLKIHRSYSHVCIKKVAGLKISELVRNALHKKHQPNWKGQEFWASKDLHAIFTEAVIEHLVDEDESWKAASTAADAEIIGRNRREFISRISDCATRLLAVSIWVSLPMSGLYRLIMGTKPDQAAVEDVDIPLTKEQCPDPQDDSMARLFDQFLKVQGSFQPYTFLSHSGKSIHEKLSDDTILPIRWANGSDADSLKGSGSFGKVYKVNIDEDHNFLHIDKDIPFALKEFHDFGERTAQDFENEKEAMRKLSAVPHTNITPYFASWTQKNIFFILMPCAEQNLRDYLKKEFPELTRDRVLEVLNGMKGLADGVRHIHNHGPSRLSPPPNSSETLDHPRRHKSKSTRHGYHRDLKPENVLCFQKPNGDELVFKISDFGSARIGLPASGTLNPLSHRTDRLAGDPAYSSPDNYLTGSHSRPNDIWSLGCICLELVHWTLGPMNSKPGDFQKGVSAKSLTPSRTNDAFWHKTSAPQLAGLKPYVDQQLAYLQRDCRHKGVWEEVITVIKSMLAIERDKRPDAAQVFNKFEAIAIQAEHDLNDDENFYLNGIASQDKIIGIPISSKDDTSSMSDLSGIDEHPGPALPYGDSLGIPKLSPKSRRSKSAASPKDLQGMLEAHHHRYSSAPDALPSERHPLTIDTSVLQVHPANPRSRSPSICLSHHDDEGEPSAPESDMHTDGSSSRPILLRGDTIAMGREDFPPPQISGTKRWHSWPVKKMDG